MTKKRMVVEIGMGTDIRGTDYTKAAGRALMDALRHNSLTVAPAFGVPREQMIVEVTIGVPKPELVNLDEIAAMLPYGRANVTATRGGLEIPNDEGTIMTVVANAAAVVYLDLEDNQK